MLPNLRHHRFDLPWTLCDDDNHMHLVHIDPQDVLGSIAPTVVRSEQGRRTEAAAAERWRSRTSST